MPHDTPASSSTLGAPGASAERIVAGGHAGVDGHVVSDFDGGDIGLLRAVISNVSAMVALIAADGSIRSVNGATTRALGHTASSVNGRPFAEYLHPDDRHRVVEALQRNRDGEPLTLDARFVRSDGSSILCEFTVTDMVDDPVVGSFVVNAQVSAALLDARNRIDFLALHDSRTGLLNRDGFMKHARDLIAPGSGLGILLIDIVKFRSVNELYGEPTGDAVLAEVATRIDQIRWTDLVTARFGADEFVVALRADDEDGLETLRQRVERDLAVPISVGVHEVNVAIRTATAFEPRPRELDALLVNVSNELTAIKRHSEADKRGISHQAIDERRRQLDQLRGALTDGAIQPHFQPIVDADGNVLAVEALVRWQRPQLATLGVRDILPLAQLAGLAEAVDDQVLELSLEFACELHASGHGDVKVHVNVDPKVIAQPAFGGSFLKRCLAAGADPSQIVVEVTENDLLAPGPAALANMQQLRVAGTRVSIDDFGTGYSSLAHLLELPVDGVKIDQRFVAGIDIDPAATNLTTAIIGLSESLRLDCVAEGVEQPYQVKRLVQLGCKAFQGWLFSPAVPGEEIFPMLPRLVPGGARSTWTGPTATGHGTSTTGPTATGHSPTGPGETEPRAAQASQRSPE
jgi:diguanylate cyclase (GGDEF)-like protein/PAS domain S-box-containing protein